MTDRNNPTVRRRRLGMELRRLREAAGFPLEAAAARLDCSTTKISRMENGRVPMRTPDVRELLELYGMADEAAREVLLQLTKDSRKRGWWHTYGDTIPSWFQVYIGLESEASVVRSYAVQFVPGLLQTEAYARALLRSSAFAGAAEDVEQRVRLRMARQELLVKDEPLQLWAVLDEAALRRPLGGSTVMREQLHHLIQAARHVSITLQVLPYQVGGHAGINGPFAILEFPERTDPDVVYLEQLTSSLYVERQEDLRRYRMVFDHLTASALAPDDSVELIKKLVREY